MQSTLKNRTIFCQDNYDILKGINSDSIDLIYLDPPFNKNQFFFAPIGSQAEGAEFKDVWGESDVNKAALIMFREENPAIHGLLENVEAIAPSGAKWYLAYMAVRLLEMHRVLKDTGSLYLHCDPTMSHYLKLVLDAIFGWQNFRNEIIWGYNR